MTAHGKNKPSDETLSGFKRGKPSSARGAPLPKQRLEAPTGDAGEGEPAAATPSEDASHNKDNADQNAAAGPRAKQPAAALPAEGSKRRGLPPLPPRLQQSIFLRGIMTHGGGDRFFIAAGADLHYAKPNAAPPTAADLAAGGRT